MKIALVGETILKTIATPVSGEEFATVQLRDFIETLLKVMLAAQGIGIAAPQVFDPRAIMFVASRANERYPDAPDMHPMVLINPKIMAASKTQVWQWEGCLSVPGLRGRVLRPDWVDVSFYDADGVFQHRRFEGFVGRIFLHEYDHLIGKTWLDHISSTDDIMANEVWLARFV
jgi:peptide deformylase